MPVSVQIVSIWIGSIIAQKDAIDIDHWTDVNIEFFQEKLRLIGVCEKGGYNFLNEKRTLGFTWMLSPDDHNGFFGFLRHVTSIWEDLN